MAANPSSSQPSPRPIAPNISTTSTANIAPAPTRRDSHPPHTPSSLSHTSSPQASTSTIGVKRPLAPAPDGTGCSRSSPIDRKEGRPQSIIDPSTGKKKRISLSCAQCAKRKQKCNREYPCQHCIARKVPELCVPYQPAPSNASNGLDRGTQDRIDKIENVLSVIVRHNPGIGGYSAVREWLSSSAFQRFVASAPSTPAPPASPSGLIPSQLGPPPPSSRSSRHSHSANHASHINTDDIELDRGGSSGDEENARVGKGWLGELEGGVPETMRADEKNIKIRLDIHGTPAENLQRLITDCGVSPHKVQELIQELPPKPFADKVIDWFFNNLNLVRYPIDERLFRISYEDLYNKTTAVDPANVRALPLVFIVLAMAVRLAPENWAGDDETRKISSLRMYWSSRRSILIATAIQSESLELVVTRLLSAMYLVLVHDRRLTECWSQLGASLRTAQAIGLHRDGSKLGLDPFQTEYRRRLWSHLYHADRLYSLILGRPPSISDCYTDCLPPRNVELDDFLISNPGNPAPSAKPLSEPTTATFLILRRQLSVIIGRIVHHFQKLNEPAQYGDVLQLQEELDEFSANLPPHFRMRNPDKSLDSTHFWLPVHRFLLLTELLVTTIILHRPWLLRRLSSNRYVASRTACFESAKLDFQIRQDFQREVPNYHLYTVAGPFKMFNSAMIAGISAIIDPRGQDADQMRKILTTFLEQHPWGEVAQLDDTTRKEVQIIHTLSRRAAQIFEDTMAPGELNAQDQDSVALLLALRQQGETYGAANTTNGPQLYSAPTPSHRTSNKYSRLGQTNNQATNTSWAKFMSNVSRSEANSPRTAFGAGAGSGVQQSPASSGGPEEDHSQRLLDHWLSANSSLGGGIGGPAASMDLPAVPGLGFVPPANGAAASALRGNPQLPSAGGAGGGYGSFGGAPGTPAPGLGPLGFLSWNAGAGTPAAGPSHPGDETLSGQMADSFGLALGAGLEGNALSLPGLGGLGADIGQESGDEYWNALIDGILGTTASNGPQSTAD